MLFKRFKKNSHKKTLIGFNVKNRELLNSKEFKFTFAFKPTKWFGEECVRLGLIDEILECLHLAAKTDAHCKNLYEKGII